MQIEVKIDAAAQETKVIVQAPCMTEEVQGILRLLSEKENKMIAGFKEDIVSILEEDAILRIYAAGGKGVCGAASGGVCAQAADLRNGGTVEASSFRAYFQRGNH